MRACVRACVRSSRDPLPWCLPRLVCALRATSRGLVAVFSAWPCAALCYAMLTLCCTALYQIPSTVREAYRRKGWAFKNADSMVQCAREGFTAKLHAQEGEGCRVSGYLDVNRVAGNFHFAPGKAFDRGGVHVHDLQPFDTYDFDTSHTVHSLSFGEKYPGAQNPLDAEVVQMPALTPTGMYSYFLKVVPTEYEDKAGRVIDSNQFSFTRHYRAMKSIMGGGVPGVFFFYDLSPLRVHYVEERRSALHFLTSVLAILGGVFTVSGMVDGMVYHGSKAIAKKMELGKLRYVGAAASTIDALRRSMRDATLCMHSLTRRFRHSQLNHLLCTRCKVRVLIGMNRKASGVTWPYLQRYCPCEL